VKNVQHLTDLLEDERLDGIVSILCNTAVEIQTVAEILEKNKFKNFTLYNPRKPHYTDPAVLTDFVEELRTCGERRERKGDEYCIIF
jgi:hypothetical protein